MTYLAAGRRANYLTKPQNIVLFFSKEALDRESASAQNGAYVLEVSAAEVTSSGTLGLATTAEVTIILEVSKFRNRKQCWNFRTIHEPSRNRIVVRPARLHSLAKSIPWNRFWAP